MSIHTYSLSNQMNISAKSAGKHHNMITFVELLYVVHHVLSSHRLTVSGSKSKTDCSALQTYKPEPSYQQTRKKGDILGQCLRYSVELLVFNHLRRTIALKKVLSLIHDAISLSAFVHSLLLVFKQKGCQS